MTFSNINVGKEYVENFEVSIFIAAYDIYVIHTYNVYSSVLKDNGK